MHVLQDGSGFSIQDLLLSAGLVVVQGRRWDQQQLYNTQQQRQQQWLWLQQ
jgi:hypothetical protein